MTPTRRFLTFACALLTAVSPLLGQTTRTTNPTSKPPARPAPTTVTTNPESAPPAAQPGSEQAEQAFTGPVTADTDKDVNDPNALRLSLDEAIRTAVLQNIGVQIQRYDYREAGQSLLEAYGPFDWFTTADIEHQSSTSPTVSSFSSSASRKTFANFGVTQLLPTGGTYDVSFNNNRTVQTGGGAFLSPQYGANANIGLQQPLLRNFGIDITRRGIYLARNTLGINSEEFRRILINTAVSVEQAYLDLVYARRFVDVQKEALFLARDQARITQIRINVGASAPLDILQPRVQIATTEEALIAAVAQVRDAEDQLRALLNLPPAEWNRPIIPTDAVVYTPMTLDPEAAVARAFDLRPELRESRLSTENARIQYRYARNQVLPRLDAIVNYGAAGVGGTPVTTTDPFTGQPLNISSSAYPHALSQVLQQNFPSWTVGVQVGVPILNIGARAEARRSELELDRNKALEAQTQQTIALDVRTNVRAIDTNSKEIVASRTAREAAEQNLDAERKRYENGMTTIFQVLQIQQQLSDARARELQALVAYNKAVSSYHRAVGDLLDVRNIQIEQEKVQEPRILSFFDKYSFLNFDRPSSTADNTTTPPQEQKK